MVVLFAVCTKYDEGVHPAASSTTSTSKITTADPALKQFLTKMEKEDRVQAYYPVF